MVRLMENNEEAILELQTKVSFQEDLLENLNQVIIDQQGQIAKLERTVESMIARRADSLAVRRMLSFNSTSVVSMKLF